MKNSDKFWLGVLIVIVLIFTPLDLWKAAGFLVLACIVVVSGICIFMHQIVTPIHEWLHGEIDYRTEEPYFPKYMKYTSIGWWIRRGIVVLNRKLDNIK